MSQTSDSVNIGEANMKYAHIKIILILLICVVSLSLESNAQEIKIADLKSSEKKAGNTEVTDYQFKIGEKIRSSFLGNCSLFIGTIDEVRDQKIDFTIQEHLWGDEIKKNKIQLNYIDPRSSFRLSSEARSPWDYVEIQPGNKLFVSSCDNHIGSQS